MGINLCLVQIVNSSRQQKKTTKKHHIWVIGLIWDRDLDQVGKFCVKSSIDGTLILCQ